MSSHNVESLEFLIPEEREVLSLSVREWLAVLVGVGGLLIVLPMLALRNRASVVESDYRIPYSLSQRYNLYQYYTTLSSRQYPALVLGDSVVWGQCALRNHTLSHYLNEEAQASKFANAGLDAMHPIALEGLLEFHAPGVVNRTVLLHFNPLWFMSEGQAPAPSGEPLRNRPSLVPRLSADLLAHRRLAAEAAWSRIARSGPWKRCIDRILESQLDVLAWSIRHPYESPLKALASPLPPSEDTFGPRLIPWNHGSTAVARECSWPEPRGHDQWQAFERIIDRLEDRGNRVLVLVGPLNEHMLNPAARESYRLFRSSVVERLRARGVDSYVPPLLSPELYADICHPLSGGYAELSKLLSRDRRAWMDGIGVPPTGPSAGPEKMARPALFPKGSSPAGDSTHERPESRPPGSGLLRRM